MSQRTPSHLFHAEVDPATLDAAWNGIRSKRVQRRRQRYVLLSAPAVIVCALALFFSFGRHSPVSSAPHVLALAGGGTLPSLWSTDDGSTVAFDDGSHLEIDRHTALRAVDVASDPSKVNLALESGSVTFDIRPGGPRAWIIEAGATRVRVLGTRFTVKRHRDHVFVGVERGKVRVESARIEGGGRDLVAGQDVDIDSAAEGALAPGPEVPSGAAQGDAVPVTDLPPAAVTPAAPKRPFATAPTPSQESSEPRAAENAVPLDDLARADAARKDGKPKEALAILQSVVDAKGPNAPLAAFTMGKIHSETLGDPVEGASSFELALRLGLPVGLDEDALARVVDCYGRSGKRSEAAHAAAQYEARFPNGRHLARVRSWKVE
jgi:transmembrane sensor